MDNSKFSVEKLIYLVRGCKVMLDQDLAKIYGVETRVLTRAVRRNIDRFPSDFMFPLLFQEVINLRSQIGISSLEHGGRRYTPMIFTEQGVAMLSSVLKSKRAVQVNIEIMRAFVRLRELLSTNSVLSHKLNELEKRYDHQFKIVFDAIREIMNPIELPQRQQIGFGRD